MPLKTKQNNKNTTSHPKSSLLAPTYPRDLVTLLCGWAGVGLAVGLRSSWASTTAGWAESHTNSLAVVFSPDPNIIPLTSNSSHDFLFPLWLLFPHSPHEDFHSYQALYVEPEPLAAAYPNSTWPFPLPWTCSTFPVPPQSWNNGQVLAE